MTVTPETSDQHRIEPPGGFRFAAVAAGVKPSGKPDVSVIVGDRAMVAAGVYTTNQVVAAPVLWCRGRTPSNQIRAVATVSGNANACTGPRGESDNESIAKSTALAIGCQTDEVLVMSTGIIGRFLPMQKVETGLKHAATNLRTDAASLIAVADAIRTTDADRKMETAEVTLSTGVCRIALIGKGAGMIAPNMATLLAVAMTDASLNQDQADQVLRRVADRSLNRITVDGHASTNDTFLLLCSGEDCTSENASATDASSTGLSAEDLASFEDALTTMAIRLGKQIVADGEGASHYMTLVVEGAKDEAAAERIARHTAQSLLVKTAITGNDPNWGRIVSAAGAAGESIDVSTTSLSICDVPIYRDGSPVDFDAEALSAAMAATIEVPVRLRVGRGEGSATLWASDLTKDYVAFNSEYTT